MTDQPKGLSPGELPPDCPAWASALFGELGLESDLTSYRVVEVLGLLEATRESLTGGAMSGWGKTDGAPEWLSMVVQAHRDADSRFGAAHVGAGWAAGKDKLAFEIEAVKDHPHGEGCGCRPCSLVRLVLGVPGCGATCDQPAVHLSGCWCHVHERDRSR